MKNLIHRFHRMIQNTCKAAGLTIIIIMALVSFEVGARYFFKHPTTWGWLITSHILGLYCLFAGIYALSEDAHITIDMLYKIMPPKIKHAARWVGLVCFLICMICLVWKGASFGWLSFTNNEREIAVFAMPLYPLKLIIPIVSFFFLLEGIAVFFLSKEVKGHKPDLFD